eukprot:5995516-Alexandrium_andersonii.AAC.1
MGRAQGWHRPPLAPQRERKVGYWWHEAQVEMSLTPNYECVDADRFIPDDLHESVEFVDRVWP